LVQIEVLRKSFTAPKESDPGEESRFASAPNLYKEQEPMERVRKAVCKRIFWRRWCDTEIFIWSFIAFQIH
jgi:hypothetical protein